MSEGEDAEDAEDAGDGGAGSRRYRSESGDDGETSPEATVSTREETAESGEPSGAESAAAPDEEGAERSSVDVEDLTGPVRRLDPRVRFVWVLQAAISGIFLGSLLGVPAFLVFDLLFVGPVVFAVVFGLGALFAVLRYRRWSYEVREDSLFLDRGVLTRTRTVVPYVRIQHVDASRGPVERVFGLATAVVYTAGSRGADVSIPGLTPDRADDLQERLKRLAIAAEGEDAV